MDIKERHDNYIQVIKGKLEETTSKGNDKNNIGNGGQGIIGNKGNQNAYGGTENAIK
jgi:hypothetical protein